MREEIWKLTVTVEYVCIFFIRKFASITSVDDRRITQLVSIVMPSMLFNIYVNISKLFVQIKDFTTQVYYSMIVFSNTYIKTRWEDSSLN